MSQTNLDFIPSKASQEGVQGDYRVMDKQWEQIQKKTFTNWINNQLKKKNLSPITDLSSELSSGEKLIELLEIIGDESLGRYNKNAKLRIQKIENQNKALEFVKRRGVALTNIGAEDIVDSNEKLILGLIWTIILRFTIAEISEEGLSAKEGLLLWCQKRTTPYAADFKIKEFTFSWQDGLALCGLIHRHRPDLLDYWALDKSKKHENTRLAFEVAEQQLGIPKLFEVEDIVDVVKPDERSVMTYVAQYFHAFSSQDKVGTAGRRVHQFGIVSQQAWEMQNDYERRARQFTGDIKNMQGVWSRSEFNGYLDAKRQLNEFETYKSTTKRGWVAERRELDSLLGNIQTKLKTYNLRPYTPPQGLAVADLENGWSQLIRVEGERKRALTAYIRDIKDELRKKYANAANNFQGTVNDISHSLASLEGDLDAQLSTVQGLLLKLEPLNDALKEIERLDGETREANVEENEYTIYSVEDLSFDFGILTQSVVKKSAFIENQIVARGVTNITPQQLEEYSETFRHFDKDGTNSLKPDEFKAALAAEGTAFGSVSTKSFVHLVGVRLRYASKIQDAEFEKVFQSVAQGREDIIFEQFIAYMKSQQEDRTSPDQLKVSFQTLASDKPYITEQDMYRGGLPQAVVDYFKQVLPPKQDGYDYTGFVEGAFVI
ncbi:hypothetical protein HK097_000722 [Rhizophlyctis rosea]|uniref:Alpha-actinin n=1 Tax=Rhizophlyctis rosea TaxID=64517 RepID=A0AAD5X2E5_9FUNG|nr:hypothetical protein HK097_000722 [Rhizophlyctis rosea]